MTDAEMDGVVGGTVIAQIELLRTGSGKVIILDHGGPSALLAGEGPDNKGVVSVQDNVLSTFPVVITTDGTVVGSPAPGFKGAAFVTVTISTP